MIKLIALSTPGGYDLDPVAGMPSGKGPSFINDMVQWGITITLIAASLLCFFLIISGGIAWISSGGDKGGIEKARKRITFAIIGLVIIFLSFMIINLIEKFFGVNLIR